MVSPSPTVFISHNAHDVGEGRRLGAQLKLVGADVWFDKWEIKAGESIPGKVDEALEAFDIFVLLWSEHAATSPWVRSELEAALARRMEQSDLRVIPVRLDDAPLPPLLRPLKYLDMEDGVESAVDAIMGFSNDRDRLRAIQHVLDEAGIHVEYFYGYGAMVACPKCGAGIESIEPWFATDYERDDEYAGARCKECGWNDGGEVW
jgi:hypothetical protein